MCNYGFNNISVISWRSVLLVEETGVPAENQCIDSSYGKLYHKCWIEYISPLTGFEHTILVGICTTCTGSYNPNYHTIMTTTVPCAIMVFRPHSKIK